MLLIPVYGLLNRATVDDRIASLTTGPYLEKFYQTLPFTVAKSLELVVFPYNLALFHEETLTPDYYLFARIVTIIFIAGFIILFFKNKFYFGILILGFIYNIYMFSPIQISWFVAERYLYFTIFIYCLLLGVFFNYIYEQKSRWLPYLMVSVFFTYLLVRTFLRFDDWTTNVKLWEANVIISADSHRVRNNLADSLVKEKRFAEAEPHFIHSIKLNPNFAEAYMNLGNSYLQQGRVNEAEVVYLKSLELNSGLVDSYLNLGIIYANKQDFSKAYSAIDKVILMAPSFEQAKNIRKEIEKYENTTKKN
jgi:tetratricopeptide (TPR) repeat protein